MLPLPPTRMLLKCGSLISLFSMTSSLLLPTRIPSVRPVSSSVDSTRQFRMVSFPPGESASQPIRIFSALRSGSSASEMVMLPTLPPAAAPMQAPSLLEMDLITLPLMVMLLQSTPPMLPIAAPLPSAETVISPPVMRMSPVLPMPAALPFPTAWMTPPVMVTLLLCLLLSPMAALLRFAVVSIFPPLMVMCISAVW